MVETLSEQVAALEMWKESAMQVLAEYDAAWEAAGKPGTLGGSKARALRDYAIAAESREKQARVAQARREVMNALGRLAEYEAMPNDSYRRDFRARYEASEAALDALIAAVRAERVLVGYGRKLNDWPIATSFLQHTEQEAREAIKRLPWPADESTLIPLYADADILAALEAHP